MSKEYIIWIKHFPLKQLYNFVGDSVSLDSSNNNLKVTGDYSFGVVSLKFYFTNK